MEATNGLNVCEIKCVLLSVMLFLMEMQNQSLKPRKPEENKKK